MKESVAIAKDAAAKKESSPTRSDKSIHRVRNEPERQLGYLRSVIGNITRNGGTPSVDSIVTELSNMHTAQRASVLLALQRTHGNRYVQRVVTGIQAKLKVGQPGDVYEQEADRVAEQVMNIPGPQVQRQPEEEEEKEGLMQTPLAEQISPLVQRQVEPEEEEKEQILQPKEVSGQTTEVTPYLESRIQSLKGSGQPLPEADRSFMERGFGVDFSGVRVHTDSEADQLNKELNAQAFTYGRDIYFGAGRYNHGTSSGKRLLAHELTHVIQQRETNEIRHEEMIQRLANPNCGTVASLPIRDYTDGFSNTFYSVSFRGAGTTINVNVIADYVTTPPSGIAAREDYRVSVYQCHLIWDAEVTSRLAPRIGSRVTFSVTLPSTSLNTYDAFYLKIYSRSHLRIEADYSVRP